MPISISDVPKVLPKHAKEIYVSAWNSAYNSTCKDREDREACASKIAWSAVKRKYKKVGDKWVAKSDVSSFSFQIIKASFDKATQEMRWRAVASDTDEDVFGDNMTVDLFDSFIQRIEQKEPPPEQYKSEAWEGGMPYLSISHYSDLDGKGIPGEIRSIYRDGNRLKAVGVFYDTELGRACYRAICNDLYGENPLENKVRISIAFLDYKHEHKDSGEIFERTSLDDICIECLKTVLEKKPSNKKFLDGYLLHLAFTRVPANDRTFVEVDKSMADKILTRKDDAASIIGEDLAEELDKLQKEAEINRSAVVIKDKLESEDTSVEESESAATEVLRGTQEVSNSTEDINNTKVILDFLSEIKRSILEIKQRLEDIEKSKQKPEPHPLDDALDALKATFDTQMLSSASVEEKLQALQAPFTALGDVLRNSLNALDAVEDVQERTSDLDTLVAAFSEIMSPINQKLDALLENNVAKNTKPDIPQRRSLSPDVLVRSTAKQKPVSVIDSIARKTVGIE